MGFWIEPFLAGFGPGIKTTIALPGATSIIMSESTHHPNFKLEDMVTQLIKWYILLQTYGAKVYIRKVLDEVKRCLKDI
jgi:hypothetical protein